MAVENIALTVDQFDAVVRNITSQASYLRRTAATSLALVDQVVALQIIAPEIDLLVPFAQHVTRIDGINSLSIFQTIVTSVNLHLINRGTPADGTRLNDRLNDWLADNEATVTQTYSEISALGGFFIDGDYIVPDQTNEPYTLTPLDKDIAAIATSSDGDFAFVGGISAIPVGAVLVTVNGVQARVGNGVSTKDCYFTGPSSLTPKTFGALQIGDRLRWNGSLAEFQLATDDTISLIYET